MDTEENEDNEIEQKQRELEELKSKKRKKKEEPMNKALEVWQKKVADKVNKKEGRYKLVFRPYAQARRCNWDNFRYLQIEDPDTKKWSWREYISHDANSQPLVFYSDSSDLLPDDLSNVFNLAYAGMVFELTDTKSQEDEKLIKEEFADIVSLLKKKKLSSNFTVDWDVRRVFENVDYIKTMESNPKLSEAERKQLEIEKIEVQEEVENLLKRMQSFKKATNNKKLHDFASKLRKIVERYQDS